MINKIQGALFGFAIGDALGVPVEFKSRAYLKDFRVTDMIGFGIWQQPVGTWSDDSSLAFCLADSLTKGYDLSDIAQNFIRWLNNGYWGAHNKVFDVGMATRQAITRLGNGLSPLLSGGMLVNDNGNGSLMRIMPLLFYIKGLSIEERYQVVKEVSSITHAHFRSVFSCFIYLELALQVLKGDAIQEAYANTQKNVKEFAEERKFDKDELSLFDRVLKDKINEVSKLKIRSGGYVIDTLEASLWCLLKTSNYVEAVLTAVNLGEDTDTTACVTGGIAGLYYGIDEIPISWLNAVARKNDIEDLCKRLNHKLQDNMGV